MKLAQAAVDDGTREPTIIRRFALLRDEAERPGRRRPD